MGNGFDLSHYLPTKYDHFMDVMAAIEKKDLGKPVQNVLNNPVNTLPDLMSKLLEIKLATDEKTYKMNFNSLFLECRDKKFIDKTKEIYDISSVELSIEKIVKFQCELKNNCWYQYFKDHVKEIETWIDFEQKIEEVVIIVAQFISDIDQLNSTSNISDYLKYESKEKLKIKEKNFSILNFFEMWADEEYVVIATVDTGVKSKRSNLNPQFCHGKNLANGFNPSGFLDFLYQHLDDFIKIFDQYLELIVSKLNSNYQLEIEAEDWLIPNKIYSFNYTNTYQRLHDSVDVEYLHGSNGEYQNIVLGISELENETLKKIKAYGFTKYQQKLFKDTDYLFLDNYKKKIFDNKKRIEVHKEEYKGRAAQGDYDLQRLEANSLLNLKFYIWGHSLDVSDKDYIIDLFSLNDEIDRNVRVTVYYFDKSAKFALLNNLLAILGKDKVEQWMKNKWLVFKKNPEVKFIEAENQQIA